MQQLIDRLTQPILIGDDKYRPPNEVMLQAARELVKLSEAFQGLQRALATFQNQATDDIQKLDKALQLLTLENRFLAEQNHQWKHKYDTLVNINLALHEDFEPVDMTEFYEINNKDRE